jgi:hypothetical protein
MIAKIGKGSNLLGALSYNQAKVEKQRGQVLYVNKIAETPDGNYNVTQLYKSFEPYLAANHKTEKPVLHISLNPDPDDRIGNEKFVMMAQDYMRDMGYGSQPYVVFKHTDIERTHIHIVSTSVAITGEKISDRFDHHRSMAACRKLEQEYSLAVATEKKRSQEATVFKPVNYKVADLKSQIAAVVRYMPAYYSFHSMGGYNALLSLFNITAEEFSSASHGQSKRGLIYFALDGDAKKASNPFKASLFGKNAGMKAINDQIQTAKGRAKTSGSPKALVETLILAKHLRTGEKAFVRHLVEEGINTVVRRTAEGRIYGITFIDHNSRSVFNGSQLAKELSAGAFNSLWTGESSSLSSAEAEEQQRNEGPQGNNGKEDNKESYNDQKADAVTDEEHNDFFGILPFQQGEDYQEQEFANNMKKKKRKGKH